MSKANLSYLKNLILAAVGIPCGIITGISGQSSAPILQPLLTWLIGASGPTLTGVTLTAVSFTAWSALLAYGQAVSVAWLPGFAVLISTFIGAFLGAKSILSAPRVFATIRSFWAFVPLTFALIMIAQGINILHIPSLGKGLLPINAPILMVITGSLAVGLIVGFIGQAGDLGSILTIPLLFYALGLPIQVAAGTAIFVLVMASLPTALIHALRGAINTNAALALSIGGVFGALYGAHVAVKLLPQPAAVFTIGLAIGVIALSRLFQPPTAQAAASAKEPGEEED